MDIHSLFSEAARHEASDLHLVAGYPPILRIAGKLVAIQDEPALAKNDTETLIEAVLSPSQKEILAANKELDFSLETPIGRVRANVYTQRGSRAASFRPIPGKVKTVAQLGLPQMCTELVRLRQGLVLVTGPTGHGKSTTIAAMINLINQTRPVHIVTIEDPIEFTYPPGQAIISQREMHGDTHSWNTALRSVLREDPDVVLIGEMRDYETIAAALTIAETGHLVFATLHTNSAAQTVDRIVDVFPENQQAQVRLQFSLVLEGILSMRLVPALAGGRIPVVEILTRTPAIASVIREGKTHQIDTIIQTSSQYGMRSLEMALASAVSEGKVAAEVAKSFAIRPEELGRLLRR